MEHDTTSNEVQWAIRVGNDKEPRSLCWNEAQVGRAVLGYMNDGIELSRIHIERREVQIIQTIEDSPTDFL